MSKDGRRINVSVAVSPIRDAEGRIVITPRKAAAAAIPERIQAIVAQMRRVTRIELAEEVARSLQVEHLRRMRSLLRP